jgi:2-iminobutanoate/2-iminopropanoate deaminase
LQTALRAEGATFDNLVKLNTYVTDIERSRPILQNVRSKYIQKEPPASTLVEVTRLADPDYLVEIEAVAAVD